MLCEFSARTFLDGVLSGNSANTSLKHARTNAVEPSTKALLDLAMGQLGQRLGSSAGKFAEVGQHKQKHLQDWSSMVEKREMNTANTTGDTTTGTSEYFRWLGPIFQAMILWMGMGEYYEIGDARAS